jgi:hypothetical protein
MSLPARLIGVILSPRDTYADVAAHPRVLGALLVTTVLAAGVTYWFQGTEIGQQAVIAQIDQTLETVESLTGQSTMTDEQYEQMIEQQIGRAPLQSAATILVASPVTVVILAAILLGVFNGILGGAGRFKQVLAVVVHSSVIWTLAALFGVAMAFLGAELGSASKLSIFAPMLESGFVFRLLSFVDLFWLWGLVSLATGLAVLYRRQTGSIATAFVGIYLLCGIAWAALRSAFGG